MNVLLDDCLDPKVRRFLPGHEVAHARDFGWEEYRNGRLIAAGADAGFDVLLTVDKNIRDQSNLPALRMPVVELCPRTRRIRIADLATLAPFFEAALAATATHRFVSIGPDGTLELLVPSGPREIR